MAKIIDDKYTSITNDIQKVQAKPTMYISFIGARAMIHLIKELINNVIDENLNENSISDGTCIINCDEKENTVTVEDTGRGIPFSELENACTIVHSGTKMTRAYGQTAGENGVGLTATNALSELFCITSYRDGMMKYLEFREGVKVVDREAKASKNKHGLSVTFKPSKIYLGADCKLDIDELDDWLTKMSFFMPESMKIKMNIASSGKEAIKTNIYQNKEGIGGFLAKLSPESNLLKTPIVLLEETTITENNIPVKGKKLGQVDLIDVDRSLGLQVAINFSGSGSTQTTRFAFCNNIENIEGGEHANAVADAIVMYFRKKVKEDSKKSTIEVATTDILEGLSFVVNMTTDYSTGLFTGQTKHKMDNKVFYKPLKKMTTDALDVYFKLPENKKTLTKVIMQIKDNIKARQAATKARKTTKKNNPSFMETTLIANYAAPNLIGKNDDLPFEIYVVEGEAKTANLSVFSNECVSLG